MKRKKKEMQIEQEAAKPVKKRKVRSFLIKHKKICRAALIVLLFFASCFAITFFSWYYKIQTNTDSLYSAEKLEKKLSKYKDLKLYLNENSIEEITYIIPGLKSTRTLASNNAGKPTVCHSMTPQGICVTEDYLLISAYCYQKNHNSVIYVMSRATHEFIKEIVLVGKPHVGSIAYDTVHQNIWVAANTNDTAYVNCFSLEDLETYFFDDGYKPITYNQKTPLQMITKASFIYYQDESLYVGYFSARNQNECVLQRYLIGSDGSLITFGTSYSDTIAEDSLLASLVLPYESAPISAQCQGMSIYGEYLFLSQSYSMKNSKLQVFQRTDDGSILNATNNNVLLSLVLPPMLEQIYIDGDDMYLMFESGSVAYRWRTSTCVDRVLRIRVDQIAALLRQ